jgi:tetratricopeptide (TPR) repeat protein
MSFSVAEKAGAIDFLNRAIAADPDFAPAHAQLALAYALGSVFRQPGAPETDEKAMAAIARAQALDPDLPEIALARSRLLFSRFGGYRGDEAVRVLLEAQRIDPNVGHAEQVYNYAHLGLSELAERAGERALEIDPTSDFAKRQVIGLYDDERAMGQTARGATTVLSERTYGCVGPADRGPSGRCPSRG